MIVQLYQHYIPISPIGLDPSDHLHAGAISDSCSAQWAQLLDLKGRRHTESMVVVSAFLGKPHLGFPWPWGYPNGW